MALSDIESILYDDNTMEVFDTTLPTDTIVDNSFDMGLFDDDTFMLVDDLTNIEDQTDDEGMEEEDDDNDDYNPHTDSINSIENLVLSFLSQLNAAIPDTDVSDTATPVPKPRQKKIVLELADRRKVSVDGAMGTRIIKYPQKAKGASIKPFAQVLKVADLMHEALVQDMPTTKRDMYYKDVELFKTQAVVDRLVDDLAATFELGRADLHVRASSKGLICGSSLNIHLLSGDSILLTDSEGTLIPAGAEISRFEVDEGLAWVLVVEKEAVFQTLCHLRLPAHPSLPGRGLIITGKGYPDVATRELLKTLSDNLPQTIPILALVDGDAYGIDILAVYTLGSAAMRHERERLAAERVQWAGLWASELAGLGVDKDALIPITPHDEKKALAMLRRTDLPQQWRRELQYMLHNRRKAEIEILSTIKEFVSDTTNNGSGSDCADNECTNDNLQARVIGEPPLLRYLVAKISGAVADLADPADCT